MIFKLLLGFLSRDPLFQSGLHRKAELLSAFRKRTAQILCVLMQQLSTGSPARVRCDSLGIRNSCDWHFRLAVFKASRRAKKSDSLVQLIVAIV
jgi:hypothetical protein